jgi:hypothetical protein
MLLPRRPASRWTLGCFVLVFGSPSDAMARPRVEYTHGDDVMKIADVPADVQLEFVLPPGAGPIQIGVKYTRHAVWGLDYFRWDPELCLFSEDIDGIYYEVYTASELAEITGVPESEIVKPIRYYLPPAGVMLGLFVVLGVPLLNRYNAVRQKRRATLLADPRYAWVVLVFERNPQVSHQLRMQHASAALTHQGIPAAQASKDLEFLVGDGEPPLSLG